MKNKGITREQGYINLGKQILQKGIFRKTRNANTKSLFGLKLEIDCLELGYFPLITTRKMFYKSFIGEYAAFLRGPKHIKDFEKFGCNYWKLWAEENGDINIDYGNEWINSDGINQVEYVINLLKNEPYSRRIIINARKPNHIGKLSLECCHYSYQFYVRNGKLDLLWNQRSADYMVGVPSDIGLAALMNITFAYECGLLPGKVIMIFGDAHIYENHFSQASKQFQKAIIQPPVFQYKKNNSLYNFLPEDICINNYNSYNAIKYDLIS